MTGRIQSTWIQLVVNPSRREPVTTIRTRLDGMTTRQRSPRGKVAQSVGIRRYRPDDVRALHEAVQESVPELSRWLPWCHPAYSEADSSSWVMSRDEAWGSQTDFSFVIFDPDTDRFLGGVGLNTINSMHRYANLGYWVRSSATKRGVASTAAQLAAQFGFEQLGLRRVEIVVPVDNTASLRVAEKLGAKREGVLRNRLLIRGKPVDAVMSSLIPADLGL